MIYLKVQLDIRELTTIVLQFLLQKSWETYESLVCSVLMGILDSHYGLWSSLLDEGISSILLVTAA